MGTVASQSNGAESGVPETAVTYFGGTVCFVQRQHCCVCSQGTQLKEAFGKETLWQKHNKAYFS